MLPTFPPHPRSPEQNHPTLLITIWASCCCVLLLLFRLIARFTRLQRLYTDDKLAGLALIPLIIRTIAAYAVLKWGTGNIDLTLLHDQFQGEEEWRDEVERREWGSKCVLVARCMYIVYVFMQKACVVEFYARVTQCLWERFWDRGIWALRAIVGCTAAASIIATLAECRPFEKYWQVSPDPGASCRFAYAQLFTFHSATVFVDILLVLAPWYPIIRSTFSPGKKCRLLATFSLGIFSILVSCLRVWFIVKEHGEQQQRALWASLDCLLVTAVCNAVVINGFVNDRGERRGSRNVGRGGMPVMRIQDEDLIVRICP